MRIWVTQQAREAPENDIPENASTAITTQVTAALAGEMVGVNDPTGLFQSKQFHTMLCFLQETLTDLSPQTCPLPAPPPAI